jgi:Ca2+/Na+ antiporter
MALGSSAPEILLSVIEALGNLGKPAGPLGASTIVGSAAFNLLVISAVAVVAVDEPKKILDTGVFATTALFSIFAYLWLYICL